MLYSFLFFFVLNYSTFSPSVIDLKLQDYGDRPYAAAGPRLWNSLSVQLRNSDITYGLFRRQLKAHLFVKHEHGAL